MLPGETGGPGSNHIIESTGVDLQPIWGLSCECTGTPDGRWISGIHEYRDSLIFLEITWPFGQKGYFRQESSHVLLNSDNF